MIGSKYRAGRRGLQEQVTALSAEVAALTEQLGTVREQAAATAERQARLGESLAELALTVSAQVEAVRLQLEEATALRDEQLGAVRRELALHVESAERSNGQFEQFRRNLDDRFSRLQEEGERRGERLNLLRGDVARMERQSAIDLDALQRTDQALAEAVLLARGGQTVTPDLPVRPGDPAVGSTDQNR